MEDLFDISLEGIVDVLISCLVIYLAVILLTRIFGLRSFAKMSGFDFAKTVAIGSMVGSVATTNTKAVTGLIAVVLLFILHHIIAMSRRSELFQQMVDNSPVLLMYNGKLLRKNMVAAEMEEGDIRSKLREANVLNYDEVKAVVMETTGAVTVIHTDDPTKEFDINLLKDVKGMPAKHIIPQELHKRMPEA